MGTKLLANICFQTQHQRARPLHTLFDDFMVQLLSNEAFILKNWKLVEIVLQLL
jgi:hypothetical protein